MGSRPRLLFRISRCYQRLEVSPADHAGAVLVATGTRPVRLETHVTFVTVCQQSGDLAFPIDAAFTERTEGRLVVGDEAILGVDVNDPFRRQQTVAFGERILAGHKSIARVPNDLEMGVIDRAQHTRGLGRGCHVAGVLVFEANDQIVCGRFLRQGAQGEDHAVEAGFRLHRPPVGKNAHDARTR
jgi:hypothetical protein